MESLVVPNQWTLDDALELIRALQPDSKRYNYHICLGGGVLNRGRAEKDLDLYFLPFGMPPSRANELIQWLEGMW